MKIKIVRVGQFDWVSEMSLHIGETHEAAVRFEMVKDPETGKWLEVYDVEAPSEYDNKHASIWTWYSDAVEVVT